MTGYTCYWCKTCNVIEDAHGNMHCFDCDDDQIVRQGVVA
jgi:hypothetical protein